VSMAGGRDTRSAEGSICEQMKTKECRCKECKKRQMKWYLYSLFWKGSNMFFPISSQTLRYATTRPQQMMSISTKTTLQVAWMMVGVAVFVGMAWIGVCFFSRNQLCRRPQRPPAVTSKAAWTVHVFGALSLWRCSCLMHLMPHASASCFLPHASCLMPHASYHPPASYLPLFMPPASCHAPCMHHAHAPCTLAISLYLHIPHF
jgi:hypothetical protein